MNKILILGASGLLGRSLVDFLRNKNFLIGALSRTPIHHAQKKLRIYTLDILNYVLLDDVIKEFDIIINCTGQITNPINKSILLNTDGINNIVKSVKKHNKTLIHISSVSVYGESEYVNEDTPVNPQSIYGSMKYFSEYIIKTNLENYTILRVSNLFGKNQKKGIINYLTTSYLHNNQNIYFNNNGNLTRCYLHVIDLSITIFEIIKKNLKGTYNVVGNECFNIKELIHKFETILNYKFNVSYTDTEAIENINKIDDSKIKNATKSNYNVDVSSYLREMKHEII